MFLTIAPKMISKKTAHQPRISYLVLDEAEDFWDALTKVSFARGRVLGSGSFPLQLLRLLKPTVSDPPELERKAAVASCCHKYSVEVFFATFVRHLCTFPSFSVHAIPRIQQKACTAPQKPLARLQLHSLFGAGMPGHSEASSFQAGAWDVRLSGRSD